MNNDLKQLEKHFGKDYIKLLLLRNPITDWERLAEQLRREWEEYQERKLGLDKTT